MKRVLESLSTGMTNASIVKVIMSKNNNTCTKLLVIKSFFLYSLNFYSWSVGGWKKNSPRIYIYMYIPAQSVLQASRELSFRGHYSHIRDSLFALGSRTKATVPFTPNADLHLCRCTVATYRCRRRRRCRWHFSYTFPLIIMMVS